MKRRQFLATTCATGLAAASIPMAQAAESPSQSQFIDFKMITAPNARRLEAMVEYNGDVAIPTANKYGVSPVGLFVADSTLNSKEKNYDKKYDNMMFVFTPHPTFDSTQELAEKMQDDTRCREATDTLSEGTTSKDPLFTAHERMLLRCFPEYPTVTVPSLVQDRILQLRMYRSHSFERCRAKIDMFTKGGEAALFEECGIKPIFFSTVTYGSFMPSIVFMLSFANEEQIQGAWAKFISHPNWKKLIADPAYADTITESVSVYLKPCKGSQI